MTSLTLSKTPILLWKHPTVTTAFILKIGIVQHIGFIRTDKQGVNYWKFQSWGVKEQLTTPLPEDVPN